jgi:hypothetical protein
MNYPHNSTVSFRKLPFEHWPADCSVLLRDPRDGKRTFSVTKSRQPRWSPGTRKMRLDDFAIFLNWLTESGNHQKELPVAAQVTKELAKAYYVDLEKAGLGFHTRARRLNGLYAALRQLAPPGDRWRWLQKAPKECEKFAAETRKVPTKQPTTDDLVRTAFELFQRAERGEQSDLKGALLFATAS